MTSAKYVIYALDASGNRIGQIDDFATLALRFKFNGVGTWTNSGSGNAMGLHVIGGGVEVFRNQVHFFTGFSDSFRRLGDEQLFVDGVGENVRLRDQLALPVTSGPPFTAATHDVRSGKGETVMKEYVDHNIGPSSRSDRRVSGLTIEPDFASGIDTSYSARFEKLIDVLGSVALSGGGLGFRMNRGEFQVYTPRDLTDEIKLSLDLGTLLDFTQKTRSPLSNFVYAGGQGEGISRVFRTDEDASSQLRWNRRIEQFIDKRQTSDPDEIDDAIALELDLDGEQTSLKIKPSQAAEMRPIDDYFIGDSISVVIDGLPVVLPIQEMRIHISGSGRETITPFAGSLNAEELNALANVFLRFRKTDRRSTSVLTV